ncbi:FXSXX-COOH protein [Actinomadura pelletieri DSM 43383]|uniref:FXSXX-COOH protein n=1 Tax=Actinomadura pelletieri DSM 43383 TaxID=1120940 RepID=A0A495QKT5_9ACTN|nr:FxSxx-COOH cyclophane-containing RiPP peptide [Actinomadura pelletieri]RKS73169.1 FXSXX-COOH protein [Actinomadura pelletieri DSM 43383]
MRPHQHKDVRSGLIDVSGLSLDDLEELDRSVLGLAVQELLDPDRHDGPPVAGFTSYTDAVD